MFNNIIVPFGNAVASVPADLNTPLAPGLEGVDFATNGPLDEVGQLWLWTDNGNDDWLSGFS